MVEAQPTMLTDSDRDWFAEQIETLLPVLFGTAVRLCRNRADAEDLAAETVAKGLVALPSLQNRDAFRSWMFRILNNTYFSRCRSALAKTEHEPLEVDGKEFSLFERLHQPILLWWGNPELEFLNGLLRADLADAIGGLPGIFREVVVMVDVEGMAYREVAEVLKTPIGTVRSRLARGRSLLQKALWDHALEQGLRSNDDPATGKDGDGG